MKVFHISLFFVFFLENTLFAGTVTKVDKKKKTVTVDIGTGAGVSEGSELCVFSTDGTKIACGKASKVEEQSADLKIGKKKFSKVKKGMSAELTKSGASTGAGSSSFGIRIPFHLGLITPGSQSILGFEPPPSDADDGSLETIWKSEGSRNSLTPFSKTGTGFSLGIEIDLLSSMNVGFRFNSYTPLSTEYFYYSDETTQEAPYVSGQLTESGFGIYADYYFLNLSGLEIGGGLDVDSSTVTVIYEKIEGEVSSPLADYTSSLMAISLRFPIRYSLPLMGNLGLSTTLTPMLPIVGTPSSSGTLSDETMTSKLTVEGNSDIVASVNHVKSTFAFLMNFALYIHF